MKANYALWFLIKMRLNNLEDLRAIPHSFENIPYLGSYVCLGTYWPICYVFYIRFTTHARDAPDDGEWTHFTSVTSSPTWPATTIQHFGHQCVCAWRTRTNIIACLAASRATAPHRTAKSMQRVRQRTLLGGGVARTNKHDTTMMREICVR